MQGNRRRRSKWHRVRGYCARATLFSPLLQQCDVHYEEQRHEEARDQYERETLHQPRVVKGAEQDRIKEIGDAKQVPEEKHSREAESIIRRHPRGHPGGS